MEVCAVVVTRNRAALLDRCLSALRAQTRPPDRTVVVDNASTDDTRELLARRHPGVEVITLPVNEGGAGGFHAGVRAAHASGAEWIWLMDDDTIPHPECLAELLAAAARAPAPGPALLSSKVVWTDGRLHPMNTQGFEREDLEAIVAASELGLLPLRTATFVSLLVHRVTIDAHGLPLRRYFLWSDDIEYTARVLRRERGYLVPAAVAVHETERPHTALEATGDRFYFHVRNTLYMVRGSAWAPAEKPSLVYGLGVSVLAYLRRHRFHPRALRVIARGVIDGVAPGAPTPTRP